MLLDRLIFFLLLLVVFNSCEKEDSFIEEKSIVTESINPHQPSTLRLAEAKNAFSSGHLREKSNEKSLYDVVPLWDSAREIIFQGKDTVLLVPYWFKEDIVQSSHENIYLSFFEGDQGVMDFGVIGFESTEEVLVDRSLDALDGFLFVGRKDFSVSHVAEVIDGTLIRVAYDEGKVVFDQSLTLGGAGAKSCEENLISFNPWDWLLNLFNGDRVRCPSPAGNRKPRNSRSNWLSNFFDGIGSAFGSNTGNTTTSQFNNGMTFWEVFGRVYTTRGGITTISNGPGGGGLNTNPSGGPGNPLNLSNFYENLEQAPVVQDLVNLLNECLTDSEDQQAALDLIQDEYLQCLDHFGEIGNPNLLVQQYLCTAAKVLEQLEFRDLSSSCAVNQLRARTIQLLLGDSFSRFVKLKDNPALTAMIWDFLQENQFDAKSKEYVSVFFSLHDENSNYKFERLEELFDLVENDPNALIADCPPQIGDWSDLASFVVTGLPLQRIQNSNGFGMFKAFKMPLAHGLILIIFPSTWNKCLRLMASRLLQNNFLSTLELISTTSQINSPRILQTMQQCGTAIIH